MHIECARYAVLYESAHDLMFLPVELHYENVCVRDYVNDTTRCRRTSMGITVAIIIFSTVPCSTEPH